MDNCKICERPSMLTSDSGDSSTCSKCQNKGKHCKASLKSFNEILEDLIDHIKGDTPWTDFDQV